MKKPHKNTRTFIVKKTANAKKKIEIKMEKKVNILTLFSVVWCGFLFSNAYFFSFIHFVDINNNDFIAIANDVISHIFFSFIYFPLLLPFEWKQVRKKIIIFYLQSLLFSYIENICFFFPSHSLTHSVVSQQFFMDWYWDRFFVIHGWKITPTDERKGNLLCIGYLK